MVRRLACLDGTIVLTEVWRSLNRFGSGEFRMFEQPSAAGVIKRRRTGDATILVPFFAPYRPVDGVSCDEYQMVSVRYFQATLIGVYLRPEVGRVVLDRLFAHFNRFSRGRTVIVGDLNARHHDWDGDTKRNGTAVRNCSLVRGFAVR